MQAKQAIQRNLKGFRDFLPEKKRVRDHVLGIIRPVFERHGFEPLETPTLEYASVLQGKYGEEADKLMYTFADRGGREVGLRYDQTVPTARVLAQYHHELPRYFRRYQIQSVFRAENTQAGRYREILQCDADIFGSTHPLADAELLSVMYDAYQALGIPNIALTYNDRELLVSTIAPFATDTCSAMSIIQSIDKLDKIETSGVVAELVRKGLTEASAHEVLNALSHVSPSNTLKVICAHAVTLGVPEAALVFSPHLARGLDYYTGLIVEVRSSAYTHGSLGGGGRYDRLIGDLGGPDIPAVGFAMGFDRTVEVMEALQLIPARGSTAHVLMTIFDDAHLGASLGTAQTLRHAGISTEVYPAADPLAKQLKYAHAKHIPYVLIIGPDEVAAQHVMLKSMEHGTSQSIPLSEVVHILAGE